MQGSLGINDYRVNIIGNNHRLFHIYMKKLYYERNDDDVMGLAAIIEDQPDWETEENFSSSGREESISPCKWQIIACPEPSKS